MRGALKPCANYGRSECSWSTSVFGTDCCGWFGERQIVNMTDASKMNVHKRRMSTMSG
jgi:hypothetical protein